MTTTGRIRRFGVTALAVVLAASLVATAPVDAGPVLKDPPPAMGRLAAAAAAVPVAGSYSTLQTFYWLASPAPSPLWSGQKCWVMETRWWDSFNGFFRRYSVGADIYWCSKDGVVLPGMSIYPRSIGGTYVEIEPPKRSDYYTVSAWYKPSRTVWIDWDFKLFFTWGGGEAWRDSDLRVVVKADGSVYLDPTQV